VIGWVARLDSQGQLWPDVLKTWVRESPELQTAYQSSGSKSAQVVRGRRMLSVTDLPIDANQLVTEALATLEHEWSSARSLPVPLAIAELWTATDESAAAALRALVMTLPVSLEQNIVQALTRLALGGSDVGLPAWAEVLEAVSSAAQSHNVPVSSTALTSLPCAVVTLLTQLPSGRTPVVETRVVKGLCARSTSDSATPQITQYPFRLLGARMGAGNANLR